MGWVSWVIPTTLAVVATIALTRKPRLRALVREAFLHPLTTSHITTYSDGTVHTTRKK